LIAVRGADVPDTAEQVHGADGDRKRPYLV
jgi:hypothetical protein